MKKIISVTKYCLLLLLPIVSHAFNSGSTGVDGAFKPTISTQLTLPPSGIFNFTEINIPADVSITFAKNASNSPVIMLVSGDVLIDGSINLNGAKGGIASNLNFAGEGGPGGFDGGHGGLRIGSGAERGGNGLGPGGGNGDTGQFGSSAVGGGFGTTGRGWQNVFSSTYGSADLRSLIGGSGGGGGAARGSGIGLGGGGGGGAILIAASGIMTVNGSITANGGLGQINSNSDDSGGGSGGAIRLIATTVQGEGGISATGGARSFHFAPGGHGRIRIEAETLLRAAGSTPVYSYAAPSPIFFTNTPTIRIATIGGENVPSSPTGVRDVILPGLTVNPVTVNFETSNIPIGTTIELSATADRGARVTTTSSPVAGSNASGTASVDINLPAGNSSLIAQASFTITVASNSQAASLSKYAKNEKVEKYRVSVNTEGESETTFITASGKEYTWPSNLIAIN